MFIFPLSGDMHLLAQVVSGLGPEDLEEYLPQMIAAYMEPPSTREEGIAGVSKVVTYIFRITLSSKAQQFILICT